MAKAVPHCHNAKNTTLNLVNRIVTEINSQPSVLIEGSQYRILLHFVHRATHNVDFKDEKAGRCGNDRRKLLGLPELFVRRQHKTRDFIGN